MERDGEGFDGQRWAQGRGHMAPTAHPYVPRTCAHATPIDPAPTPMQHSHRSGPTQPSAPPMLLNPSLAWLRRMQIFCQRVQEDYALGFTLVVRGELVNTELVLPLFSAGVSNDN